MPRNLQDIGVTCVVQDSEVADLTDDEQDELIRRISLKLTDELQKYVGGARPRSDLKFWVTGPHTDPLQGVIHAHHLAAKFDVDELPNESGAYRTYVLDSSVAPVVKGEVVGGS